MQKMTEDVNGDRCYKNAVKMIDTRAIQDLMSESNLIHLPSAFPGAGYKNEVFLIYFHIISMKKPQKQKHMYP